ncbi:MAG TPA: hypothetical protein VET26_02520 [Candidatus Sulfotelmatobacter sp.]|nr:hypothetical protein [Candidatus Sulfotelmatobacter sp.]
MKAPDFFAKAPVFSHEEFATSLAGTGDRSPRTIDSVLAYHVRAGHILRVRRGLYVSVPRGADPKKHPVDPFLLAGRMTPDAVLAYHTALEFHGKAYSVHKQFVFLTALAPRAFSFRGHRFRPIPPPKALRDAEKESFGVATAERAGVPLKVTSLERTLVDVLDRHDLAGGWEEAWRSLESVEYFDLDQVVAYTLLLGNATTAATVGLFLEQHREALMVDEKVLKRLRSRRPRQPHYLERGKKEPSRLVSAWNLVVPERVLDRAWEEPA